MNQIELIITENELINKKCPVASDKVLKQAIDGTLTGIVTYIKLVDDQYQILSQYTDDKWTFPISKVNKSEYKTKQTLNFNSIADKQMKQMAKWFIWCRMKEGLSLGTLGSNLKYLLAYFKWVNESETIASQGMTTFTSRAYIKHINSLAVTKKGGTKPLSIRVKENRLYILEMLHKYCKEFEFIKEHPWPESGVYELIGKDREPLKRSSPKTLIIPDEVLMPLSQFTKSYLDRADEILTIRDKLSSLASSSRKTKYIESNTKFNNIIEFKSALILLRDSCIIWLLLTTGMRIHEVLGIKRGSYRCESKDEITFYYIKTISQKTYTGLAEWIAPKIAIEAIDILSRYSEPFQIILEKELAIAKANNNHVEVNRLESISNHVCVTSTNDDSVSIMSGQTITKYNFAKLCELIGTDWHLTSHQFRRTFANYVVHSELGDLRALKDHFKHWSITMTALYAFNEDLDAELFDELLREKYLVEEEIKQDWFELDTPITGGEMADNIKKVREDGELIKTFGTHKDMAKAYSSSIPIRSTGIGWCTNDEECKCGKPDSCESGIVDKRHLPYWEGMLVQQMKLLQLDDIGESGKESVKKGMKRCEKVLSALGVDVEAMKQEINQKEKIEVVNV